MTRFAQFYMRVSIILLFVSLLTVSCKQPDKQLNDYPIIPLTIDEVEITDGFWAAKIKTSREVTVPHILEFCKETGRIDNFRKAAGEIEGPHLGERYNDTDVFKTIEGVSYHLQYAKDESLEKYIDSLILIIEAAQEDDGYIYTPRTIDPLTNVPGGGSKRWEDVWISHELYNAGHLYEAAVAYFEATGKRSLLEVALKNADHVISVFNENGLLLAPGHQEIEIGLVKLFKVTGEKKYLDQALFFLDQRGRKIEREREAPGSRFEIYNEPSYLQYHLPVREQDHAVGHAVRAMYMYAGMTDAGYFGNDTTLLSTVMKLWDDIVSSKIYITGGVGASHQGEAFSDPFDLPNETAYCETCAAAGSLFWNHRMFSMTSDTKYMDVLETTLYNGFLSGVSLDGSRFFYPNPLESKGKYERSEWFGVACCPGNIARVIPSIPRYIYSKNENSLFVNLFIDSKAETSFFGKTFKLEQQTNYPWEGKVKILINSEEPQQIAIRIRIPGWSADEFLPGGLYKYLSGKPSNFSVTVNGEITKSSSTDVIVLDRKWEKDDVIEIEFPMEPKFVISDGRVEGNSGKVAIVRGPLVYTAEGIDNLGTVQNILLKEEMSLSSSFEEDLLDGVTVINTGSFQFIPYYSWANRGLSDMRVWLPLEK